MPLHFLTLIPEQVDTFITRRNSVSVPFILQ